MEHARAALRAVGWPFRMVLVGLITAYRSYLSPLLGPRCKYHPSCSAYGLQAVKEHGAFKGTALTSWRLLRCNPFSKGGFDPVPPHGRWLPDVYPDGKPRRPAAEPRTTAPSAPKEA